MQKTNLNIDRITRWDLIIFLAIIFYFTIQLLFFSTSIRPGIAPDELRHAELSHIYAQYNGLILPESEKTYHWGTVSTRPFLYHYLMGRLLHINIFKLPDILFLRFVNILLGILTALMAWRFFRLISSDKIIAVASIIVLTNIPMFAFLSSFVNYDNLVNLFAIVSFYFIFKFLKDRKVEYCLIAILFSMLGMITKVTFIPLFFILILVTAWDALKNRKTNVSYNRTKTGRFVRALIIGIIAVLFCLNCRIYCVNIYKYKDIYPSSSKVLEPQQYHQEKDFRVHEYLHELRKRKKTNQLLTLSGYLPRWYNLNIVTTFGIFGHMLMLRNPTGLLPYRIAFFIFFIFLVKNFRISQDKIINYLIFASFAYMTILLAVNYKTYQDIAYVIGSIQGRYMFPVIVPIVFLFCYFLINFLKKKWKYIACVVIACIFIWGNLPYFVSHADKSWYINSNIDNAWDIQPYVTRFLAIPDNIANKSNPSP